MISMNVKIYKLYSYEFILKIINTIINSNNYVINSLLLVVLNKMIDMNTKVMLDILNYEIRNFTLLEIR